MKNKQKSQYIPTKLELAKRLEIARATLDRYLSMPGSPEKTAKGYDLGAMAAFVAEHAQRESTLAAGSCEIKSLRAREIGLRCDRLALRLAKERNEMVFKADVAAAIYRIMPQATNLLEQKLINEWPSAVAGLDVPQARVYGRRLFDDVLAKLKELGKEFPE